MGGIFPRYAISLKQLQHCKGSICFDLKPTVAQCSKVRVFLFEFYVHKSNASLASL